MSLFAGIEREGINLRLSAFPSKRELRKFFECFWKSLLKLPMFTLIGSLNLIFKELRWRISFSAEKEFYLIFFFLSRDSEVFLLSSFAVSSEASYPLINSENPCRPKSAGVHIGSLAMTYFHWKYNQLSSAQRRFTVLFGMGRSGTTSLWSSGKGFAARAANSSLGQKQSWAVIHWLRNSLDDIQSKKLHGYRIKLHEQLVMVSWVPHSTYTPILSTSWSRTTL